MTQHNSKKQVREAAIALLLVNKDRLKITKIQRHQDGSFTVFRDWYRRYDMTADRFAALIQDELQAARFLVTVKGNEHERDTDRFQTGKQSEWKARVTLRQQMTLADVRALIAS